MEEEPEPPREHAGELERTHLRDGAVAADRREVALVPVVERLARALLEIAANVLRGEGAHLHGRGSDAGHRLAVRRGGGEIADDEDLAMPWHAEVGLHLYSARTIERGAEILAQRRGRIARGPQDRVRVDPLTTHHHVMRADVGRERAGAHVDADVREVASGVLAQRVWIRWQDARTALEQHDARLGGIDAAKVVTERSARDGREHAGQLDARRSAAHDDEGEPRGALLRIVGRLGALERGEHAPPDLHRVVDALEARRERLPFRVREVRVARAGADDEIVVLVLAALARGHLPSLDVDVRDFFHEHRRALMVAQQPANGRRDVGGRERRRRHLIEQRLEEMMVRAIEHEHVHVVAPERARCIQPTEPATDDDDTGAAALGHPGGRWRGHGRLTIGRGSSADADGARSSSA